MKSTIEFTPLNSFLWLYFYLLENELNHTKNDLEKIKFQSEEANTDEYLKKYFQAYILENNRIQQTDIQSLLVKMDNQEFVIETKKLETFQIQNVYLPEELTDEQKSEISKSKPSVYTSPDLYLEITNGQNIFFESLELKSTKTNNIPGSSVQQVSPFEWVIFVKRNSQNVTVTTGFYIHSITEKLPFPDRSPRPQVGFKTLSDWNKKCRKVQQNQLLIEDNLELNAEKIKLLTDWQDHLTSEWLKIIQANNAKTNEKWFNNAIRKFAVKFLEYTDSLDDEAKENLKSKLNKLIK